MKFAKRLQAETFSEWEDKYIAYKLLKQQLNRIKANAIEKAASASKASFPYTIKPYLDAQGKEFDPLEEIPEMEEEKQFFKILDENRNKVDKFYQEQMQLLVDQFHTLCIEAIRLVLLILMKALLTIFKGIDWGICSSEERIREQIGKRTIKDWHQTCSKEEIQ